MPIGDDIHRYALPLGHGRFFAFVKCPRCRALVMPDDLEIHLGKCGHGAEE
jgi:hypothetical protein